MNDNSKLVSSLLLGAAAGAAIALYLTSENGSKFRQSVSDKAGDLLNDLKEKAEMGKDAVASMTDKFSAVANDLTKKATTTTSNAGKTAAEMYV